MADPTVLPGSALTAPNTSVNLLPVNTDFTAAFVGGQANLDSLKFSLIDVLGAFPNSKGSPHNLQESFKNEEYYRGAILVTDSSNKIYSIFDALILSQMNFAFKERADIMETFGAATVSFFGDTVPVYQFSGTLVEYFSETDTTHHAFHGSSFQNYYNTEIRGSVLSKKKRIAVLKLMNHAIYGYPISLSISHNSGLDKAVQFSLQWLVTSHDLTAQGLVGNKADILEYHYDVGRVQSAYSKQVSEVLKPIAASTSSLFNIKTQLANIQTNFNLPTGYYPTTYEAYFSNQNELMSYYIDQGQSMEEVSDKIKKSYDDLKNAYFANEKAELLKERKTFFSDPGFKLTLKETNTLLQAFEDNYNKASATVKGPLREIAKTVLDVSGLLKVLLNQLLPANASAAHLITTEFTTVIESINKLLSSYTKLKLTLKSKDK
jgi:hypothetical protein